MPAEFGIVDITGWKVVDSEVLGRNPKVWVREPGGGSDRERDWLSSQWSGRRRRGSAGGGLG
jgi:hypothetical protein